MPQFSNGSSENHFLKSQRLLALAAAIKAAQEVVTADAVASTDRQFAAGVRNSLMHELDTLTVD